jgi:hypothetical protein
MRQRTNPQNLLFAGSGQAYPFEPLPGKIISKLANDYRSHYLLHQLAVSDPAYPALFQYVS